MQQNNKEKGRLQKEIKHWQYENRWQPDLKTTLLSDKRRLTLNDVKKKMDKKKSTLRAQQSVPCKRRSFVGLFV